MIVRVIDVYVVADTIQEFKEATVRNHDASVQEPGILRFDVLQDNVDPSHFVLYEVYASDAASAEHKETSHYAEWKAAVEPMMAKARASSAFTPIAPTRAESW